MENKIKHLEFIQSNIARMNQCSFNMKGWAIAILSALLAVYAASIEDAGKGNAIFILVAIVPTILFWFLDSYYLQQERKFRGIYNDVAEITEDSTRVVVKEFEFPLQKYCGCKYCFFKALFSKTEAPLYLIMIIGIVVGYMFLR